MRRANFAAQNLNTMLRQVNNTPKQVKDAYLIPLDTEPTTIVEAMSLIVENAQNTGLTQNLYFYLEKPIRYLSERLHINEVQVVLLSVVTEIGTDNEFSLTDISHFFNCTNLKAVSLIKELEDLAQKKLVEVEKPFRSDNSSYRLPWGAVVAYSNNEVYVPKAQRCEDCEELLHTVETFSFQSENGSLTCREFQDRMLSLLRDNAHLDFVKALESYHFDANETALVVCACVLLCCQSANSFSEYDFFHMVDRRYLHKTWKSFQSGDHKLLDLGLVEPVCDNGMEDQDTFTLTKKAKDELLTGVKLKEDKHIKRMRGMIQPNDIVPKNMFYNETEKAQLKRLEGLLMQDRYIEICTRLKDNGMRTGFACLFYGAPGTGKTETVMQLARVTGRNIFQVNMANIRDKWVGESEKNVKAIFSQYQNAVRNSSVTPILLLNEADALLGGRFTEVNRSVERMENTMQNIILEEMEKLNGILIATTNLTCNLDSAFERRFLFKVEFHAPEASVRKDIWRTMIPQLDDDTAMQLAMRYDFSGGQIENIARKSQIECILEGSTPGFEMLRTFCDEECLAIPRKAIVGFRV